MAPTMVTMNLSISVFAGYTIMVVWWFLIGAILGLFVPKTDIVAVIWLAILFSGAWIFYLVLKV